MSLFFRRVVLFGIAMLVTATAGWCGTFSDPSGFSLTYPDDWAAVTRDGVAEINAAMPVELKDAAAKLQVDFNSVTMALIRNVDAEFVENLNVVVERQQIPVNPSTVKKYTEMLGKQYATMGIQVENMQGRVQKFGANEALVVEYRAQIPGVAGTLWQRQAVFPGGGKSFIVTCTAKSESFEQHLLTFDQILASFQVPAPIARGFDWNQVWSKALTGAIVGGFAGGLGWIVQRMSKRNAAPQEATSPERGATPTDSRE